MVTTPPEWQVSIESADASSPTAEARAAVERTLVALADGLIRVAEPGNTPDAEWTVNIWIKKAILLAFAWRPAQRIETHQGVFRDKLHLMTDWERRNVRAVPGAIVREGAYVAPGVILMPCLVNVGAYVGKGTMVDAWSTVGSCAQIGQRVHLSGGVGIGGVLEPPQAAPVIIEDDVFVGARSEVAEGVRVRAGAVLAMGCYVGASTPVYDATTTRRWIAGNEGIPERAVVVPGTLPSRDGRYGGYALIIKKYRDEKTDARVALESALRD